MYASLCSSVYLDADFLISFFARQRNSRNTKAKTLWAFLVKNRVSLYTSLLTIDELWNGLRKSKGVKETKLTFSIERNNGCVRICYKVPLFYAQHEVHRDVQQCTDFLIQLLRKGKIEIINFGSMDRGIRRALLNIERHKMKPRDAFHLSYMQEKDIKCIATFDKKFQSIEGINVLL